MLILRTLCDKHLKYVLLILLILKTIAVKNPKKNFFLILKRLMLNSEDIQTKMYILNITHLQKCLQSVKLNGILQKLKDCFVNINGILNVLLTKFKYNIATYNLDEYKSYAKQSQVIYS